MAVFKCKMCGGALEITDKQTVATCEYCGSQQTLPRLDDEKRASLYDRANHFRRNNDFDKATSIYEQILAEDNTDAEAYWSLVLCKYGIEYVEDPATNKRIPTVNRAQYTSIYDDDNYQNAIRYADSLQKAVYESEAKTINAIQRDIIAISQQEEPFDVFICYKETDANGRRTRDSVIAQELYHELTEEGYKVFFARITLEDKLGSAYEPYIFAALNSAKVMVVLGTKPEYFNAVWVKNEWSRYLTLIKNGAKKMLIPAYRDMDPYNLPDEFSHLQAQDMAKLGFMQDLIHGIKKIANKGKPQPQQVVVTPTVVSAGNASVAPLLRRAFMFLEDSDWDSANEYAEKVLDVEPENVQAYLVKMLANLRVTCVENLEHLSTPFNTESNYRKVVRFADEKLKKQLEGYIDKINEKIRIANEKAKQNRYNQTVDRFHANASTIYDYQELIKRFSAFGDYKDATRYVQDCKNKIVELQEKKRSDLYDQNVDLLNTMGEKDLDGYKSLLKAFKSFGDYKDAKALAQKCEVAIDLIEKSQAKAEEDRKIAEAIKKARAQKEAQEQEKKKKRENTIKSVSCLVVLIIWIVGIGVMCGIS